MHLILTHEQADFDAIASLYGAFLVSEDSSPILPRRMNRNARAFVTLYGADFPFLDPRDQPQGAVDSITLVDTQSLVTVKGMSEQTAIQVIDHHPLRKGLPENWDVITLETGATTTFFAEQLQELGEPLSAIQATLLLLGIYEDTGSLTYASTTPRDVRAAAFLLEQGASLRIAADFLNPPLSSDQRETYDRLVSAAETIDLNGHRIILACGEMANVTEEVSTLAHKLRDLFDPAALFVLVKTIEGVRLVARSTTDSIDVAAVAAHFGGGGHDRAAAALVRLSGEKIPEAEAGLLDNVRAELVGILPRHVRPSITAAQIMSRRPRTLKPDTPVQEAARLMAKYGYEGFPVVENERVVGLLTRRAVDRAINHRLNLTAASLMEAGAVSVHPGESLQNLQLRMTESGWGQIPVVDAESGKVIGIVTRTDLLKTIAGKVPQTAARGLASRLEASLPPASLDIIRAIAVEATSLHLPVFIVGGFVRDLLLERPGLDFDIVVEGDAIALARDLAVKFGGRLTSHSRFGTAKWFLEGSQFTPQPAFIDLISSRQEFYEHPTALPTVERGSIKLDLHRRDFTINTLALRLDGRHFGELHDYYGGLSDLERRFIRVLHSLSFVDDPTRMLRAVRYEQRYGFSIEPRTLQLIEEARPLIARLSSERIRHELDLIFDEPRAVGMLSRLGGLGLLNPIVDVLPWDEALRERLDTVLNLPLPPAWRLKPPAAGIPLNRVLGYLLWLAPLPPALIETVHHRLRFPLGTYKALLSASQLLADLPSLRGGKPSAWAFRLEGVPLAAIYAVFVISGAPELEEYALKWQYIHSEANGHTLQKLGLKPGPSFQDILNSLRAAWLDGEISTPEQESALLHQLVENLP